MNDILFPVLSLLAAYLLGSIPFGLLIAKLAGHGDIRAIGSGNIGATNVLRTGKKSLAAATLLLDMLKGTLAVWIALLIAPTVAGYAALLALLGHMFPIWLKFKGGKGVATTLGVMLGLAWPVAVMAMLVWLATALLVRISSLSALVAVATMPVFVTIFGHTALMGVVLIIMALVIFKHKDNVVRLLHGTEPHISFKGKNESHKTG